jgi:hypothetical protein
VSKIWGVQQDKMLRSLWFRVPADKICERMGFSNSCVWRHAKLLGLTDRENREARLEQIRAERVGWPRLVRSDSLDPFGDHYRHVVQTRQPGWPLLDYAQ